jgi:hypothetical protein
MYCSSIECVAVQKGMLPFTPDSSSGMYLSHRKRLGMERPPIESPTKISGIATSNLPCFEMQERQQLYPRLLRETHVECDFDST